MSQVRQSGGVTQVQNVQTKDRLRSRDRINTGQQILNVNQPQNSNQDIQQNRLKNIKANYQNEGIGSRGDGKSERYQQQQQRGGSLNKLYNVDNQRLNQKMLDSLDQEGVVFKNNGKLMNGSRGISHSKYSVSTKQVEQIINQEPQTQRVNNHRRGQSDNFNYLDNLQQQDSKNQTMKSFYDNSPVAKHYSSHLSYNQTMHSFNKKLKMRDTFTKIFPSYTHGTPSVFEQDKPVAHLHYIYRDQTEEGKPTHQIDRTFTKKNDFIKIYTEEILKIANMRRNNK